MKVVSHGYMKKSNFSHDKFLERLREAVAPKLGMGPYDRGLQTTLAKVLKIRE